MRQGGPTALSRVLSGTILGGGLGLAASILIGVTPIGVRDTPEGAVVEALLNVDLGTFPTFREMLLLWWASFQDEALSGTCVGGLLGIAWGAFRR